MSSRSPRGVRSLLVAVGMTLLTLVTTHAGHAAVGDALATVTLPVTTNCASEGTDYGTALAVVPGGKMGFQSTPTLLATSCITFVPTGEIGTTAVSKIFFVDPSTNPATLK